MDTRTIRIIDNLVGYLKSPAAFLMISGYISHFFAYLYQALAGKLLTPSEYITLVSLISLFNLSTITPLAFGIGLTKKMAALSYEGRQQLIKEWLGFLLIGWMIFGVVLLAILGLWSSKITAYLRIEEPLLLEVAALLIFLNVWLLILMATVRGFINLIALGFANLLVGSARFIFGFGLILLGWGVLGGLWGFVISVFLSGWLLFFYLRDHWPVVPIDWGRVRTLTVQTLQTTVPVMVGLAAVYSFFNVDVLLVKRFFPPAEAGLYGAGAILGRIVYFGSSVISGVSFPLLVDKVNRHEKLRPTALLYFALSLLLASLMTFVYWIWPHALITLTYNIEYLGIAPHLWLFGIFIGLLSLNNFFLTFFWAINRFIWTSLLAVGAMAQFGLITLFHPSLLSVLQINIFILAIVFGVYLIVFLRYTLSPVQAHKL